MPISEIGTASAGMKVADAERRNRKITRMTSAIAISRVSSTSATAWRIEIERSISDLHVDRRRDLRRNAGSLRQHGIDHRDGVGVGLLLDRRARWRARR